MKVLRVLKELGEGRAVGADGLASRCLERRTRDYLEFAEASRVDEAQLTSRCKLRNQMRMLCAFGCRIADQHSSGHPQMHDPLRRGLNDPATRRHDCVGDR